MPLTRTIETGLGIRGLFPGLFVPQLDEREAALFCGYTWREWCELDIEERIFGVAHHRLHSLIESHSHEAVQDEMERRQRAAMARARHR